MIYLTTGANGAGKTLNVLKWVREQQLKESRPVYYNGRFEMVADFGWIKFDFKDWQSLPDGAIFFVDECHNDMPVRGTSAAVPDEIRMLAEHRRRGFDFYLLTQHPQNIDLFVRRLIGSPGWHRHLKRTFGVNMVSCLEWPAVNSNCEKAGAGKDAKITMIPFPKEVFTWYNSAQLHTGKKAIPKQVYVLVVVAILVPLMFYAVFQRLSPKSAPDKAAIAASSLALASPSAAQAGPKPLTVGEYVQSYAPRIDGFPGSASRYDAINVVQQVPKPAACIQGRKPGSKVDSCKCWSQQATVIQVPDSMCRQIAAGGWFDDTLQPVNVKFDGVTASLGKTPEMAPPTLSTPVAVPALALPTPTLPVGDVAVADVDVRSFMRRRVQAQ